MHFSEILEIQEAYRHAGSHDDILGDGFLLQSNPIYRNIKTFALKIGCQYIEAYPEYLLLPFHELPRIVESRKIPYIPSARLMKDVERGRPGLFATEDLPMPESYHLHEAAHVIAEHFLKDVKLSSPQERILKALMAESFANTIDALACVSAADDIHYFFIKQNCYMFPHKKIIQAMNNLIETMGFRFTFMLTFFTYLNANFLTKPLSKKSVQELIERYAPDAKTSVKLQRDIRTVCGIGEKLDPLFRVTTTGNYLKQQGFEGEIQDLLHFPFMKIFAKNREFGKAAEGLCGVVT